jgi:hypothetical protein
MYVGYYMPSWLLDTPLWLLATTRSRQGRVKLPFYPDKGVEVESKGKDMTMGVR